MPGASIGGLPSPLAEGKASPPSVPGLRGGGDAAGSVRGARLALRGGLIEARPDPRVLSGLRNGLSFRQKIRRPH